LGVEELSDYGASPLTEAGHEIWEFAPSDSNAPGRRRLRPHIRKPPIRAKAASMRGRVFRFGR
jgi:hypothetical protein